MNNMYYALNAPSTVDNIFGTFRIVTKCHVKIFSLGQNKTKGDHKIDAAFFIIVDAKFC